MRKLFILLLFCQVNVFAQDTLQAYIDGTDTVGIGITQWSDLGGNAPFIADTLLNTGYANISTPENWETYYVFTDYNYCQFRNSLIGLNSQWGSFSDVDKQVMIRHFVYPSSTPIGELDALYTQQQRNDFKVQSMANLSITGVVVRRSKTINSVKYFSYEVNDSEILFTDEILSDVKLTDL